MVNDIFGGALGPLGQMLGGPGSVLCGSIQDMGQYQRHQQFCQLGSDTFRFQAMDALHGDIAASLRSQASQNQLNLAGRLGGYCSAPSKPRTQRLTVAERAGRWVAVWAIGVYKRRGF